MKLHPDLKEFVELFRSHRVEFLVVGGNQHASGRGKDIADWEKLVAIRDQKHRGKGG